MCLWWTCSAVAQSQHTIEARRATHHFSLFNPLRGAQKSADKEAAERKEGGGRRWRCGTFYLARVLLGGDGQLTFVDHVNVNSTEGMRQCGHLLRNRTSTPPGKQMLQRFCKAPLATTLLVRILYCILEICPPSPDPIQNGMRRRTEAASERPSVPHACAPTVSATASGATPLNCQSILPSASTDTRGGGLR